MSVRSNIREHIVAILQGITTTPLSTVKNGRLEAVNIEDVPIPSAYVLPGTERLADQQAVGYETWDWSPSIELWCANGEEEAYLEAIHTAMAADHTLGGHAILSNRINAVAHGTDEARGLTCIDIMYRVLYRHSLGVP